MSREGFCLLRLHLVEGMGPRRIAALREAFGSATSAWQEGPDAWAERVRLPKGVIDAALRTGEARVHEELHRLEQMGAWVVTIDQDAYPALLRETSRPPAVLFGRGRFPSGPTIGIVGTRRPSPAGRAVTADLAADLARGGAVIASGMAEGIDAEAHRACLDAGGRTVAVVAHGLDHCYPAAHKGLMDAIAQQGAVVTEFPLGTGPRPGLFPVRNRIIVGVSLGIIVVEAGIKSGAMGTATWAAEEGRDVFAVPGDVRLWASKGPHRLLREGAILTESAQDVWDALPHIRNLLPGFAATDDGENRQGIGHANPEFAQAPTNGESSGGSGGPFGITGEPLGAGGATATGELLGALRSEEWTPVDELIRRSGRDAASLLAELTREELYGRVESDGHGRWRLRL